MELRLEPPTDRIKPHPQILPQKKPSNLALTFILSRLILMVGLLGNFIFKTISGQLYAVVNTKLPITRNLELIDMSHDGLKGVATQMYLGLVNKNEELIKSSKQEMEVHKEKVNKLFSENKRIEKNKIFLD